VVVHACNPSAWEAKTGGLRFQSQPREKERKKGRKEGRKEGILTIVSKRIKYLKVNN
jgi:hypothetical protein